MALLQIDRGAFPRRYGVKTTQYQYVERGQKQTVHYIYTETDDSITPIISYIPTTNFQRVCGLNDPTSFDMWLNNGIYPVSWNETTITRKFNENTEYEFTLDVITACRAICNGTDVGGWSFGSSSAILTHNPALDYHDYTGSAVSTSILDSNGQPTSQCYISGARGTLHGGFQRAILQNVSTPTPHIEYAGTEDVMITTTRLNGNPVVSADIITHTAYNCNLTLSYS